MDYYTKLVKVIFVRISFELYFLLLVCSFCFSQDAHANLVVVAFFLKFQFLQDYIVCCHHYLVSTCLNQFLKKILIFFCCNGYIVRVLTSKSLIKFHHQLKGLVSNFYSFYLYLFHRLLKVIC